MNYTIVFLSLLWTNLTLAQHCFPMGVELSTQVDIDQFSIDNPNCIIIEGDILISGGDITNISPLEQIVEVSGSLIISNCTNLQSIVGNFNGLQIDGSLIIKNNPQLENIVPLSSVLGLKRIEIRNNTLLENIVGFNQIDSINTIAIAENESLEEIEGFENLIFIQDSLYFSNLENLQNIPSFNNIVSLGLFQISGMNRLKSIEGFLSAQSVTEIQLNGSDSLSTFKGFNNIEVIKGICSISSGGFNSIDVFNKVDTIYSSLDIRAIIQTEPVHIFENLKVANKNVSIWGYKGGELLGFKKLNTIGFNNLSIFSCNFENLNFLQNLTILSGFKPFIWLADNPNLVDISGLDGINPDMVNWFRFINNPKLSICHSDLVCAVLERGDNDPPSIILNNAPGCLSVEEILEACESKVDPPIDQNPQCPMMATIGMQVYKNGDHNFDILYRYGEERVMIESIKKAELAQLLSHFEFEKYLLFNFDEFDLKVFCDEAVKMVEEDRPFDMSAVESFEYLPLYHEVMLHILFIRHFIHDMNPNETVKL